MNRSVLRLGLVVLAPRWLRRPARLSPRETTRLIPGRSSIHRRRRARRRRLGQTHRHRRGLNAVSNSEGLFSIPSLPIGTYTVTVTLQGFKTFVTNDVVLTSGRRQRQGEARGRRRQRDR